MNMKPRFFITILLALFILRANGAVAEPVDLVGAYKLAVENDAGYASAKARRRAEKEKIYQARSLLGPSINLEGDISYTDDNTEYVGDLPFGGGRVNYVGKGYRLNLEQPLFHKEFMAVYRQSKIMDKIAQTTLSIAGQSLALNVAKAYFDLALARDRLEFITARKKAISEQLARAKKAFEVGIAAITDMREAQAEFDMATSQEITARQDLEITRAALRKITGKADVEPAELKEPFTPTPPDPADLNQWITLAEKRNLTLETSRQAGKLADEEVNRSRADLFPTVDIVANYNDYRQDNSSFGVGINTTSSSVGLKLSMPLFTGGAASSKIREAMANADKAASENEETARRIRLQTRTAFLRVQGAVARVKALEQALGSSQSALESTQGGFEVGLRSEIDVLNAQERFFNAKFELARAKYNYILSRLQLSATVGGLDETDLAAVSAMQSR